MADMTIDTPGFARIKIGPMAGKSIRVNGTPGVVSLAIVSGVYDVYVRQGDTMASAGDDASVRMRPHETRRWDNSQGNDYVIFQFYCAGVATVQIASGAIIG